MLSDKFMQADLATSHGKTQLENWFTEILMKDLQIQKKGFMEILKVDRRLGEQALENWIKNQAKTYEILRRATWLLPFLFWGIVV